MLSTVSAYIANTATIPPPTSNPTRGLVPALPFVWPAFPPFEPDCFGFFVLSFGFPAFFFGFGRPTAATASLGSDEPIGVAHWSQKTAPGRLFRPHAGHTTPVSDGSPVASTGSGKGPVSVAKPISLPHRSQIGDSGLARAPHPGQIATAVPSFINGIGLEVLQ